MDAFSPIVSVISLLCSCSGRKICKLKDHQESLRSSIQVLKNKRADVTRKVESAEQDPNVPRKRLQEVEGWLEEVETIEGKVDEVLQKVDRLIGGMCLGNYYCPLNCWSGYNLGKYVIRKLEDVEKLISRGNFTEVAERLPPPPVQEILADETVGMDSILQEVLSLLGTDGVHILGLYGAGGVGKTTLLRRINNEYFENRTDDFDVIIWAVVSKTLNVANIQKQIGKRLGLSDGNQTAVNISSALKNRKFMLLLDDLWEPVDLRTIGIPPPGSNSNSKIVLTTRFEDVCTSMRNVKRVRVNCLKDDEAWSLFRENVGDEALNLDPQILELARAVTKECAGLPLALITIGRAMSNAKMPQEWRDAVTTLTEAPSEFRGMDEEVLLRLKLSYDSLRNKTYQSCFLYCSLYPEDYLIEIEKLIDLWIVEGLLEGFDDITDVARNRGHHVIGTLKSACLLENGSDSNLMYVKMHDVIRDLALWIVSECGKKKNNFVVKLGVDLNSLLDPFKEWKDAERICLYKWQIDTTCGTISAPDCPNLSTLIINSSLFASPMLFNNFFECMHKLKTLDLSGNENLSTLPTSITGLVGLEYLNLSLTDIEKLPHELMNLVKLKYLNLRDTIRLQEIPSGILSCLSKLQVLNLDGSVFMDWVKDEEEGKDEGKDEGGRRRRMDEEEGPNEGGRQMSLLGELDNLKYMVDLRITITTRAAVQRLSLSSSRNLHISITKLNIYGCKGLRSLGLSPPSTSTTTTTFNLGYLKNLRHLKCWGCIDLKELRFGYQEIIGVFSSTLESLTLGGLPKLIINWDKRMRVRCYYFKNLHHVKIDRCNALTDLTWLVCLRNLQTLEVSNCERIEEIIGAAASGFEDEMSSSHFFFRSLKKFLLRSLKKILLFRLPSLKSICRQSLAFPCLEVIYIEECPELKKLPLDSTTSNVNNTLKEIRGDTVWWNQLQWADVISESNFRPYLHNPYI